MSSHTTTDLTDLISQYVKEAIKSHVCNWECMAANAEHPSDQMIYKAYATAASIILSSVQIAEVEAMLHHANGRPLRAAQFKEVELPQLPKRPYSKGQVVNINSEAVSGEPQEVLGEA
jgi:hypothetical protein